MRECVRWCDRPVAASVFAGVGVHGLIDSFGRTRCCHGASDVGKRQCR